MKKRWCFTFYVAFLSFYNVFLFFMPLFYEKTVVLYFLCRFFIFL
jgi:hypothetical protein